MALLTKPTATELRSDPRLSAFLTTNLPVASPDPLDDEITVAWAYIELYTCLDLDSLDAESAAGIVAKRSVILRLLQQLVRDNTDFIVQENTNLIKSFSVPGYSETRADSTMGSGSGAGKGLTVNEWPQLNSMMVSLMRDECYDKWLFRFSGEQAPFSDITEFDWFSFPSMDG